MTNGSAPIKEKMLTLKSVKNATYKFIRIFSANKNQFKKPSICIPVIDDQNTFFDQRLSFQNDFCRSDSITIFDTSPQKKFTPPNPIFSGKLLILLGDPIEKQRIVHKLQNYNFHEIILPIHIKKAALYLFKIAERECAKQDSNLKNSQNTENNSSNHNSTHYLESDIKQNYKQLSNTISNDAVNIVNNNSELISMNHIYHVNEFVDKVKSYGSQNVIITNIDNLHEHNFLKSFFSKNYKIVYLKRDGLKNVSSCSEDYKTRDSSSSENSYERKSSEGKRTFVKTATYNTIQTPLSTSCNSSSSFENLQNINFDLVIKKNNESDLISNIFEYKNDEETIEKIMNLWDQNNTNQTSQLSVL